MKERQSSPYRERREEDKGAFESWLLSAGEGLARHLPFRRRRLATLADRIEDMGGGLSGLSDDALRERAENLRPGLLRHGFEDTLTLEAFALVREASSRCLGKRHYRVQLMGGLALVRGMVAEMQTGEGKTITAALAAVTGALAGLPVHVVTVNDYLAERDAEILEPLYAFFGLTSAALKHGHTPEERRAAYKADIVHGANKEIAFDYLKDRITLGRRRARGPVGVARLSSEGGASELLMRGLGLAIVDEADSVLVDEARTPLIISYPSENPGNADVFPVALDLARGLTQGEDFTLSAALMDATLTESGRLKVEAGTLSQGGGVWVIRRAREALVRQGLAALHLYHRERHYVVRDGKVEIVDEFTGRIAEGRSWEGGLQQLVECKEGCEPSGQRETRARITYQRFFRRYLRLSGMSGTVFELAGELRAVYDVPVVRIPPNRPNRRTDLGIRLLPSRETKWRAVASSVRRLGESGRPILIGTQTIEESVALGLVLVEAGLDPVVLNAHQDGQEAEIVARSGEAGRVTVATNMAGRGTDIQLAPGIAERGGLHVVVTGFAESVRIDRQIVGRGGRQGDPSSFEAIVSLEDDLFLKFARYTRLVARAFVSSRLGGASVLRRSAQAAAERYNKGLRRATLQSERQLRKSLSFSGEPE